jgi:hypothetical protein
MSLNETLKTFHKIDKQINNHLLPSFITLAENKKINWDACLYLSYIPKKQQEIIKTILDTKPYKVTTNKAKMLRFLSDFNSFTKERAEQILAHRILEIDFHYPSAAVESLRVEYENPLTRKYINVNGLQENFELYLKYKNITPSKFIVNSIPKIFPDPIPT